MKLTKENEKIMRKAKRYIRTFPLSTEEIRQIEEEGHYWNGIRITGTRGRFYGGYRKTDSGIL